MKKIICLLLIILSALSSCAEKTPLQDKIDDPAQKEETNTDIEVIPEQNPDADVQIPSDNISDEDKTDDSENITGNDEQKEEPSKEVIAIPEFYSPLTGLPCDEEDILRRPIAVMINCDYRSLPQTGTSTADIIYECELEGGTVRMLAVYESVGGDVEIGSTRSSRPYFIDMAQIHGAVYVHSGGSPEAYVHIADRDIDNLDGVNMYLSESIFYRNAEKRKTRGYEHSLMTTGNLINRGIELRKYNTLLDENFSSGYNFKKSAENLSENKAEYIKIPYSSYVWTEFNYSAQTGLYTKSIYGEPQIDESNGETLTFTNVVIIFADHKVLDGEGRLEVTLTGSGNGYYFSNGTYIPIKWSRQSSDGPISYTTENGEPLLFNPGKTFISVSRPSMETRFVKE